MYPIAANRTSNEPARKVISNASVESVVTIRWNLVPHLMLTKLIHPSLGVKIGGLAAMLLTALFIVGIYSFFQIRAVGNEINVIVGTDLTISSKFSSVERLITRRRDLTTEMAQYRVQNRLDKVGEAVQETGSASGSTEPVIVAIQQLIVDPETGEPTARYSQLHALLATLMTQDRKIAENTALLGAELQQIDDYNRVTATQFLSTVITETDSIEQTLVQVDEQMLVLIEESAASAQSKQRTAITATSIVGLVALLAGAITSVLLVRRLTRSVRVVSTKAREMRSVVGTDEFVHQDIPVISSDEIGELASVFNEMSANLERNIEVRRR